MNTNKGIAWILAFSTTISQIGIIAPFATTKSNNDLNKVEINNQTEQNTFKSILVNNGNLAYSDKVFNLLSTCEETLYKYLQTKDITLLKKCIDIFCSITPLLDSEKELELYEDENFYALFYKIRDEIYKIPAYDMQSDLITYYGEKIFIGWRKNKDITLFKDIFLKIELIDYNKDKNQLSQPRLEYLGELCLHFMNNQDSNHNSDKIPSIDYSPPNKDDVLIDNNNKNETLPENNKNESLSNTNVSISNERFEEYVKKNNSCVKVVTFYKNGKPTSTKEYSVSKNDYVKCGIYSYVHSNIKKPSIIIDRDYIDSNQNEESSFTIHFTINKSSKRPYYYDTGIRTSALDNSVSYNQLKDALYQTSIKTEGFFVTDNNKSLAIMEGKPIVLKKSKNTYSKAEVERLLNSFINIEFKILKPTQNNSSSLNDYLSNEKIDSFLFNDKVIKLSSPFILVEGQIYGPIQEITTHLGAKTSLKGNILTILNDTTKIKININSKSYTVNGKEILFESSPMVYNSSIYSIVNSVISELGYEINWDDELGELSIYNK